jgi:hypothetical protein
MSFVAASTFMTAFGQAQPLQPGRWSASLEPALIPHLDEMQRRVGLGGFKEEDLNRTPVFGRLRLSLGLPAGFVAEVGYTPPLTVDGTRPRDFVAIAFGHRLIDRGNWTLSGRVFGQHGVVEGDITCPSALAGIADPAVNVSGCQAASDDQIRIDYYGADLTGGFNAGDWHWHASVGAIRTELAVQVDALVFDQRDRSRLVARDVLPYLAIGGSNDLDAHWTIGAEVLYVPLTVKREFDRPRTQDPFTTIRFALRYTD